MSNYKKPYLDRQRDVKRERNREHKKFKQRIVRKNLYTLVGKTVQLSGVIERKFIHSTKLNRKPILLTDCVVDNDLHTDHFWASISDSDRKKLLLMPNNTRVYFTCVPHLYTSRQAHESAKVGVQSLKLLKE